MKRMIACAALVLIGAVLMTMPGVARSGDILPHKYSGHETIVVDMATNAADYTGRGKATHLGRFTNAGTGTVSLQTGDSHLEGAITGADGSQIFWVLDGNLFTHDVVVTLSGGTGRFETASGELTPWVVTNENQQVDGGFVTITFDSSSSGWISF